MLPLVVAPSTLELLAWIGARERTYADTIDAWRTTCPRLSAWEDALADDFVRIDRGTVVLTTRGRSALNGAGA
jgi:hypothetical protein